MARESLNYQGSWFLAVRDEVLGGNYATCTYHRPPSDVCRNFISNEVVY